MQSKPLAWLQIGTGVKEGIVVLRKSKPNTAKLSDYIFKPLFGTKQEPLTETEIVKIFKGDVGAGVLEIIRLIEKAHGIGRGK